MKHKNIGIDAHVLGDHSGGNESYYHNILLHFVSLGENYTLYLFVKNDVDTTQYPPIFNIVRFKSKNAFSRNFIELPHFVRKYKLDLLHTQYFIPFKINCKIACTIHDICFEHFDNIFNKKQFYTQKLLIPYAAKHSDVIFTVSEHAKIDIAEKYKINNKKIIVTYNAVNNQFRRLTADELNQTELKNKFKISSDGYILSVGNLQPRKNLVRLIMAFKDIHIKNQDINLVIVGKKAWMFESIISEALDESICNNVIFTDYVSEDDLIRLYNGAKCFVYPSYYEGFGIPPLEAMACQTPVAVSNATSLPEVCGDAAVYFDPYDVNDMAKTIESILADEEKSEVLVERGKKRVDAFSWRKTSILIESTYKQLL